MHGYIRRLAENDLHKALQRSPTVAILGPRQCGKSTLAKEYLKTLDSVYLDLQNRQDLNRLNEPELFFEQHRHELICLDEIQRLPEFFSTLRSEIDKDRHPGRFLILGSASRDLIKQSNETLAGRIAYLDLTPFQAEELPSTIPEYVHWNRGGFPDSLLAANDESSYDWRQDFIRTFLERDIPALGFNIPAPKMERLWILLAHYHGQTVNFSKLAEAAELTLPTLKKYMGLLEQTYMLRLLSPYEKNSKKRLVKSPKVYIRDSGILHGLLNIENNDQLLGNPVMGASWEGYAIENLIANMPRWKASFFRSSNGGEIDLIMELGDQRLAFEFKASKTPRPSRGFHENIKDIQPDASMIIAPVDSSYMYSPEIKITNLKECLNNPD